jgi:hypothetical protein
MGLCLCGKAVGPLSSTTQCDSCYKRDYRKRVRETGTGRVPRVPTTGGQITYRNMHRKVRRWRGSATLATCVDCGKNAHEWSYMGGSKHEVEGTTPGRKDTEVHVRWSTSVWDYVPRCVPCHRAYDRGGNV